MIKVTTHATSARNPVVPFISLVIPSSLNIENTVCLTLRDQIDVAYNLVAVRLHGPIVEMKEVRVAPSLRVQSC